MKNYPKNTGSEPSALPAVRQRRPAGPPCTPQYLRQVFAAADNGDIEPLCLLGREILERNWDVIGALEQRTDALCGLPWSILPGGPTEADRCAAEKFSDALSECGLLNGLDTCDDLIRSAAEAGISVRGLSEYYHSHKAPPSTLVLGYGGCDEETIMKAASILRTIWA